MKDTVWFEPLMVGATWLVFILAGAALGRLLGLFATGI
jgi:hypothetical protein